MPEVLAALRTLPPDLSAELREVSQRASRITAGALKRAAASSPTPQARLVALSITTPRDRLPAVKIGGTKRVGRVYRSRSDRLKSGKGRATRAMAGALLWGSENGSDTGTDRAGRHKGRRFVAGHNATGYWIGPTVRRVTPRVFAAWERAATAVVRKANT